MLLEQVYGLDRDSGLLRNLGLINRLKAFREEFLHILMYRDWEEFENFIDEIVSTYQAMEDLTHVLHRFTCYLEPLLKQVGMRDVLVRYQHIVDNEYKLLETQLG